MKRFLLVFALFLSVTGIATAQKVKNGFIDDVMVSRQKSNSPTEMIQSGNCQIDRTKVYTIPVVVHVVHIGEAIGTGSNISNAQIMTAISDANKSFRAITGDGVDMQINLQLAITDPDGNPTNGITRNDGRVVPGYEQNGVAAGEPGGIPDGLIIDLDIWPTNKYYNIWIVHKTTGYVAYSQGLSTAYNEGTVITYTYMEGSTVTHETGHYFGLMHPFFGATETEYAPNDHCETDGDGICDTPPLKIGQCNSVFPDGNDPLNSIRNYMGYCGPRTRFTADQKTLVRNSLFEHRLGLITISAGIIPATTALEMSVDSVIYNDDLGQLLCKHELHWQTKITNIGTTDIDSFRISRTVDGVVQTPTVIHQHIAARTTVLVTMPVVIFTSEGNHDLTVTITKFNASSIDYRSENNTICSSVYALIGNANVIAVASPPIGGTVTGSKTFTCDGNDTLNAVEKTGYNFTGWYDDGILMTTNRQVIVPIEVWMGNRQFVAQFSKKIYSVSLTVNPANTGTITGSLTGNYPYQTVITSTAKVNAGYKFVHWKKDGAVYQTDSVLSVSVLDNANYDAVFSIVTGIKQNMITDLFNVYPNPTNGTLFVNVTKSNQLSGTLSVMNMIGEELQVQSVSGSSAFQFNLDQFAKGSYFLLYKDDQGNVSTYKFVLQ